MEYKKDIKNIGLTTHISPGGMVIFGATLAKKCERIATAIYLVTNFLSDTEPMKARLRTLSLGLVRDASSLKSGIRGVEANVLEEILENISETLSLFELAFVAGLVSEMNFTILKREYASLRSTVEVKKSSRESLTDNILSDTFFNTTEPSTTFSKRHSIRHTPAIMSDRNVAPVSVPLRGNATKQASVPAPIQNSTFNIPHSTQIESRRNRILKLAKDNREVTIKDISAHFPDLSEKTIQRELVSLVESNVLKKFGERRWSRYALS